MGLLHNPGTGNRDSPFIKITEYAMTEEQKCDTMLLAPPVR